MKVEDETPQIRVLVVDDSAFMRLALSRMISSDPTFAVVGTACCGAECLQRIGTLNPDVITLDLQMPGGNGLETLRNIMKENPRPVIMVSSATLKEAEITFSALEAGAFDCVPKRLSPASLDIHHIREELLSKIRAAAESDRSKNNRKVLYQGSDAADLSLASVTRAPVTLIALGTSTGGPKALGEILAALPGDLPAPILVAQHMPPGFSRPFADRMNNRCALSVREASPGENVEPGVVYIAPSGFHMTVNRTVADHTGCNETASRTLICISDKPGNQPYIPSVDILMESVARVAGCRAMGIILTGMGSDGAQGIKAIHREGGFTVGQDEASSAVYSMPRVCGEMGILDRVVPLSQIAFEILRATRSGEKSMKAAAAK